MQINGVFFTCRRPPQSQHVISLRKNDAALVSDFIINEYLLEAMNKPDITPWGWEKENITRARLINYSSNVGIILRFVGPRGKVLTTGAGSEFITKCSHGNRNLLSHEQWHPTEKFCSIQLRARVDTTVQRNLAISGKTNDYSRSIVKSSNDENSFS